MSPEHGKVFLSICVRLGDVLARCACRGPVTVGRALNLFPISPPASHTHKLFTSLQRSHELLISNLVSPSNMFTHSTAIPVQSLGHMGMSLVPLPWLPWLPCPEPGVTAWLSPLCLCGGRGKSLPGALKSNSLLRAEPVGFVPSQEGSVLNSPGNVLPVLFWVCCSKAAHRAQVTVSEHGICL